MNDDELLRGFEAGTLPAASFRHREHLRVAWLLLRSLPFEEGAARFAMGVERLAAASGVPEKFDQAITSAYLVLLNQRMHEPGAALLSFDELLARSPELCRKPQGHSAPAGRECAATLRSDP